MESVHLCAFQLSRLKVTTKYIKDTHLLCVSFCHPGRFEKNAARMSAFAYGWMEADDYFPDQREKLETNLAVTYIHNCHLNCFLWIYANLVLIILTICTNKYNTAVNESGLGKIQSCIQLTILL